MGRRGYKLLSLPKRKSLAQWQIDSSFSVLDLISCLPPRQKLSEMPCWSIKSSTSNLTQSFRHWIYSLTKPWKGSDLCTLRSLRKGYLRSHPTDERRSDERGSRIGLRSLLEEAGESGRRSRSRLHEREPRLQS